MQSETIEINYREIDLNKSQSLSLCIKSNILKKVSDVTSCYSYTYSVPLTEHNKSILGQLLIVGSTAKKVRRYLPATYYRDGLKIFEGMCYVSDVDLSSASVVFLFGVKTALQNINKKNGKLNELYNNPDDDGVKQYSADDLYAYKRYIPLTSRNMFAKYPFDSDTAYDTQLFALQDSTADIATLTGSKLAVRAKRLFDLMRERYGLDVQTSIDTANVWVQTAQSNRKDRFKIGMPLKNKWRGASYPFEVSLMPAPAGISGTGSDLSSLVYGIDYDVYEDNTIRCIKSKYRIDKVSLSLDVTSPSSGTICYTNVSKQSQTIGTVITENNTIARWDPDHTHIEAEFRPEEMGFEYEWDANQLANGETVFLCSSIVLISDDKTTEPVIKNVDCMMYYSLEGENLGTGYFNSIDCLPSISVVQFLQDFLFGVAGQFIVNDMHGGNKLKAVSLSEIATNTPYDWSNKLDSAGLKVSHKIDGLGQKNIIKWATSTGDAKKTFIAYTNDNTIDEEKDYYNSNFGKMDGLINFTYYAGQSVIPSPKFLRVQFGKSLLLDDGVYALAVNDNFNWIDKDTESWQILKKTIAEPLTIECKIHFSTADLATLDVTRPVWFEQFGALFYIDELKVGAKDIATAKLTRLGV